MRAASREPEVEIAVSFLGPVLREDLDRVGEFGPPAAAFFGLSLFGYTTKTNLQPIQSFLFMGIIGVLLISLIAPGTMPIASAHGVEMIICTGHGPQTMTVAPTGAPADDTGGPPCHWATAHQPATEPGQIAPAATIVAFDIARAAPRPTLRLDQKPHRTRGARAPPSHL